MPSLFHIAATVIVTVVSIHLACRNEFFRKFLAGVFFLLSGGAFLIYFAHPHLPIQAMNLAEITKICGSFILFICHVTAFSVCIYFGFIRKLKW